MFGVCWPSFSSFLGNFGDLGAYFEFFIPKFWKSASLRPSFMAFLTISADDYAISSLFTFFSSTSSYICATETYKSRFIDLFSTASFLPAMPMNAKPYLYSRPKISFEPSPTNHFLLLNDKLLTHSSLQAAAMI